MSFKCHADWPVAIAAVGPGYQGPARVHKGRRLGNGGVGEHFSQHFEAFRFRELIALRFDAITFVMDDCHKDDVAALQKSRGVEALPDRIVATRDWVGVEEELRVFRPECLVELVKDLGVCAHLELVDRHTLPVRQLRVELDDIRLQDSKRGCAKGVFCFDAGIIGQMEGHTGVRVVDPGDSGIEDKTWVVVLQKARCSATEPGIKPTLVVYKVVGVTELIEGQIVAGDTIFESG